MEITSLDKQILDEIAEQIEGARVYEDCVSVKSVLESESYTLVTIGSNPEKKIYYVYAEADVEHIGIAIDVLTKYGFEYTGDSKVSGIVVHHVFEAPKEKKEGTVTQVSISEEGLQMMHEIANQIEGAEVVNEEVVIKGNVEALVFFDEGIYNIDKEFDPEQVGVAIDVFTEHGLEYIGNVEGYWYEFAPPEVKKGSSEETITELDLYILKEIKDQIKGARLGIAEDKIYIPEQGLPFIYINISRGGKIFRMNRDVDIEKIGLAIDIFMKYNMDYVEGDRYYYTFSAPKEEVKKGFMEEATGLDKQVLDEIANQVEDAFVLGYGVYEHNMSLVHIYLSEEETRKLFYVNAKADTESIGTAIDILTKYGFEFVEESDIWYKFEAPKEKMKEGGVLVSLPEKEVTPLYKQVLNELASRIENASVRDNKVFIPGHEYSLVQIGYLTDKAQLVYEEEEIIFLIDRSCNNIEAVGEAIEVFSEYGMDLLEEQEYYFIFSPPKEEV